MTRKATRGACNIAYRQDGADLINDAAARVLSLRRRRREKKLRKMEEWELWEQEQKYIELTLVSYCACFLHTVLTIQIDVSLVAEGDVSEACKAVDGIHSDGESGKNGWNCEDSRM